MRYRCHLTPDSKNKITTWFAHHATNMFGFYHYLYISSLFIHVCQLRFWLTISEIYFSWTTTSAIMGFYTHCGTLFVLNFEVVLSTTHLYSYLLNGNPRKAIIIYLLLQRGYLQSTSISVISLIFFATVFIEKHTRFWRLIYQYRLIIVLLFDNIFRLRKLNQNNRWSLNKLIRCDLINVVISSRVLDSLLSSM